VIELRHLRYFVAVAEELHFGKAAHRLHMSQSPLSRQIRELEHHLGVELVERGHSVAGLTPSGRAFYESACEILSRVDAAAEAAVRASRGEVGRLSVGYLDTLAVDLVTPTVCEFKRRHPAIQLDLVEGSTGDLLEAIDGGSVDVALVAPPPVLGHLCYQQLLQEFLVAAVPAEDRRSPGVPVSLAELPGAVIVPARQSAPGLRTEVDAALDEAGVFRPGTHVTVLEARSVSAMVLLVACGSGWALVPASAADRYPVAGVHYALVSPSPAATGAGLAWRPRHSSPAVDAFRQVAVDVAPATPMASSLIAGLDFAPGEPSLI
jgi:DNA-binding transcriptional LysR family regulator